MVGENNNNLLKGEVGQPDGKNRLEARLDALEKEISELRELLSQNEGDSIHKIEKQWARPNSNRRPPPCQGSF